MSKKFKVVRRFMFDEPVIEKSFDDLEKAEEYLKKAVEESRSFGVMKPSFKIETDCDNYESEED